MNVSLLLSHHPNPHPSGELLYVFGCDCESSWSPTLLLHTLCFIHCRCRDQAARFTLLYIALFKTVFLNVLDGFMCVCFIFLYFSLYGWFFTTQCSNLFASAEKYLHKSWLAPLFLIFNFSLVNLLNRAVLWCVWFIDVKKTFSHKDVFFVIALSCCGRFWVLMLSAFVVW